MAKYTEELRQAWKEVFEVEEVADDADFFAEGGDSIMAVQLSSWLQQKGIKLDLGKIFYTPVFSDMAETLEETEPMYVPDELMTKELINEKLSDIMQSDRGAQSASEAKAPATVLPGQAPSQADAQVCDPKDMPAGKGQAGAQVCDPAPMPARNSDYDVMISMFQTMLAQQQVMLQMMQVMLAQRSQAPQFVAPMQGGGMPFRAPFRSQAPVAAPRYPAQVAPSTGGPHTLDSVPPEARAQLAQQMQRYQSHPVDKPIDKPNVIGLKPAKVTKAEHSAEEVLDHVLSGLLEGSYSRTEDLFEQGLTSFDVVKMITRCGEHGYALSMQDVYMHSTFNELLEHMKPGK
ncbi:MAG: phosphopantetheine-binding protein [Coriobacteriales bacterium]|nr:phosphopantetheine-binding protein [Coriobacteriales bacterium]